MPTYKPYITGFVLCVAFTLGAYFSVVSHSPYALLIITALAVVQLMVQLVFFLYLGRGPDSHWNLVTFFSMVSIVVILIVGSIWIMNHLNYNMMSDETIIKDEGVHK